MLLHLYRVILVHSHASLLASMAPVFPPLALARLQHIGVEVILNDRVVKHTSGSVTLSSGRVEEVGLYLPASAGRPYTKFMPADAVDDKGYVKTKKTFQVESLSKVFSFGSWLVLSPLYID